MCFAVVLSFAWITGTTLLEVGAGYFRKLMERTFKAKAVSSGMV